MENFTFVLMRLTAKKQLLFVFLTVFFFGINQQISAQATYTWNQTGSAAWGTSTNWTPSRTSPASNDILQFNNGATTSATGIPNETIGKLLITGNTTVTLSPSNPNRTLAISGGSNALSIASGSSLNVSSGTAFTIVVNTGSTGSITGNVTFTNAAHTLEAADANGITFNSPSVFTQGAGASGGAFGTGTSNSVIFTSGTTFSQAAGANPFQKTQPASVVVFQTGSLFKVTATGITPAFSGRTYANFEWAPGSGTQSPTGSAAFVCDNLTVTSGTLNIGMTGTPGHAIKGNISVASGATLTFNPASAGTLNFNGTTAQTITNAGTLTFGTANQSIVIANTASPTPSVTFNNAQTIAGNMTVNSGSILATSGSLTLNGTTNTINGSFQINQGGFGGGGTWTYGSSSSLIYNYTQTTAYGPVDATHKYWPSASGPANVILQMQNTNSINAGAVQLGGARTITGTLSTSNANGRTMTLDLNGNTFQAAALTVGTTAPLTFSGTTTTTITGNVNYSSNLTINGDLKVGGNWTKASSGLTFTRNSKAVFFTGSGTTQTITVTGGGTETFDYLLIDKATAGTLTLATGTNLTIAATSGNTFEIKTSASTLNLNGQTINFSSTGGSIFANGIAATINGAAGSKIAVANGTKTFSASAGSWSLGSNVSLEANSGVNFGSNLVTLNGTFKILNGGFASGNTAPIYASGSTLEISNGGSFSLYDNSGANESAAWFRNVTATGSAQQGVPWNFVVSNSSSVNWNSTGGDAFHRDINGNFTITSGSFAMSTTASGDLLVKGNFTNNGTFTANGRTVTLNGTSQSISGATTTFQDLVFATSASTKTLGVATTVSGNLNINTGVKADLGTFASTSATLTTGGTSRGTGASYGGTGSPAANIDTTFFAANSGYLNVGSCTPYSLTGTANTSTCISTTATVSVTALAGDLPVGTYAVFYTLTGTNTGSFSATMTVSTAGSGSFTTSTLSNSGSTTITINYLTNGCVSRLNSNNTATITVNTNNVAGSPSSTPTLCINTALTAITHSTTGATGIGTPTGLPAGVTAGWSANVITISGTPTASGTFNYSIPLTGGCGSINATGTIIVTPNNIAGSPSSTPTLCINTALTSITHSTTGATGIGTATGLPSGVTAGWSANVITISGTPTASGTFNYSIPLTGGCGSVNATGTITVNPNNTVGSPSSTPTLCVNTALTPITHSTTGATGIGTPTNLPSGVTAGWSANVITISGTPTTSGTFNYSIPLTGGCGSVNATGTITVNQGSTTAVISGSASICSGSSTNLQVNITGGVSPYTVVYTGGTLPGYVSGTNISVSPSSTTNYTLTSVTDANGCVGTGNSGTATVTITTTTSTDGGATWDNGTPSNVKAVVFNGSTGTVSSDISGCSLRLTNNATVTVDSAVDITLSGAITVDSGSTFTLNNNANLLQSGTTNSNSGTIVVKRNSSALKRLDYTLWSSPVTGQGVYSFSPFTFGNRFYVYRTNTNLYNNGDVGFSLTSLNSDGVNGSDSNNVQFATAKGYLIRMPWDHPTAATIWNGTFTGVPNNGDITFTMTNGGAGQRFNLIGNPYPSPISMTQFVSDNSANITGTLYFWRETNGTTANNAYCSWAGGTFTTNGEAQVFNPNGIIRTGQGFFVEASGGATTVDFKNGQRSSDNSNQFFRTANVANDLTEYNRFWLNLTNSDGAFSQMAAGYISNATDGVDIYDGRNINTGSVLLNSILDNADYTIQGKALPFNMADVIPLSYKVTNAGQYSIAIDHVDGLFGVGSQAIYLKDNLTSTEHNLQTGAYVFASVAGTFNDRFEIVYQSQLGIENPTFNANNIIIYNQNNDLVVDSGHVIMKSVKIFDIRGRLLQERTAINSNQTIINGGMANAVLLVQVTSEDGVVVTKKVIK